jgi:multisubunit Na+/H+ antiporter MnhG subunit
VGIAEASPETEREIPEAVSPSEPQQPDPVAAQNHRRFRLVAVVAIVVAAVPYLWVLWDLWTGTWDPLRSGESRTQPGSVIYDVQARALLHGHFSLPPGSISIEAFVHHGRTYTYFGIFPSLIRMPILLFTHSLDGRLTGLSLLAAWMVTALFSALLLWRIRIVVRGGAALGWSEALSYGLVLFSVLVGSVLVSLASMPNVYSEDEAWGVALTCGSLFALLGVVERPSWGRVTASGVLVLLTNLNRGTTGYACILATGLVAAWFALGRAGAERRRWALPVLLSGLVALVVGCTIDYIKFDLFFGFPASEQLLYKAYDFAGINKGKHFSLHFLPSTLQAYLSPTDLRFTSVFPYVATPGLPTQLTAHTRLFNRGLTSSISASMPLLLATGLWGTVTTFLPHRPVMVRSFRPLLVAAAASGGAMLIYGTVYERFLADFLPFLVLAGAIGVVDIYRRLDGRTRTPRLMVPAAVGLLALFGFVANMGIAITPQSNWTQTQAEHYVQTELDLSDLTGHPLAGHVVRGDSLPTDAPIGQLFVKGDCQGLYISDGLGSAFPYPNYIWRPVELAPHTPICRSLLRQLGHGTRSG